LKLSLTVGRIGDLGEGFEEGERWHKSLSKKRGERVRRRTSTEINATDTIAALLPIVRS
jgi:hypothetical protein